ncbi:MAG: HAMP domain-containing histidine kinase [Spirochaetales bacterium]|nr:HAMP domain-containing histidine kinase [Spirochaetales bacterium]
MKLRSKFAFLIAAIIVIPFFLTVIISYGVFLLRMNDDEVNRQSEIMHWMVRTFHKTRKIEDIYYVLDNIPEGLDVIILDSWNMVLVSSISNITKGTIMQPDDLLARLSRDYPARSHLYDPSFITGPENAKLFFSINLSSIEFAAPLHIVRGIYLLFFILLLSSSVTGVMILGSFRTSIIRLEQATRRVAKGDLDFKLEPRGKDEIASLTRSFDSMREQLKEEYAKRSRFLMAVSHDLSTPLTSIKGYIEAIKDGLAKDPVHLDRYISIISDRADLLETRISELIEFVRMETGEWRLRQKKVRLRDFLNLVISIFKEDALIFKRRFIPEIDVPDIIFVTIDRNLLLRAMENLFHNAIRYTHENDEICFRAVPGEKGMQLILSDSGEGIEEEELDHIFDPFFRGKKLDNHKGFGLGLSIVKSILGAHGWDIRVESEKGRGTAFFIMIGG